jgi:Cu/Ag efflux pump CusA
VPLRRLQQRYDKAAPKALTRTTPALLVAAALALVAAVATPFLDMPFRPDLEERNVVVSLASPAGTSLPRMTAIATQAVEDLGSVPGVSGANAQVGRAVMSDKAANVNEGEVWVSIDGDADYDATVARIEEVAAGYDDVTASVTTYSAQRVTEVFDGGESDVAVRVFGENPDVLTGKAEEVRNAIAGIDGVTRVAVEPVPQETTLEVQVDLQRAQDLGVKPGDVRRAAAILVGGITVGNLFQEQKVFDVVVWGAPETRQTVQDIRDLLIDTPTGGVIRLGDVADVTEAPNDAVIRHEDVARFVQVTADVRGRSLSAVNDEAKEAVAAIEFPLDHHAEVLGDYAENRAAVMRVLTVALAAALVVFLLFQAAFRSWRLAAIGFLSLPVSLVGGLLGVLFTGGTVTLGVLAGLIAVLGLAARGVVTSIDHLLYLQRREHMDWGQDLVLRGTRDRLLPDLTMVLAVAAVMIPVAVAGTRTGLELLGPAAIAVLGGMVTTLVVNSFIVPVVVHRFGPGLDRDSWVDDLYEPVPDEAPVRA